MPLLTALGLGVLPGYVGSRPSVSQAGYLPQEQAYTDYNTV